MRILTLFLLISSGTGLARDLEPRDLFKEMRHLRGGGEQREWDSFPEAHPGHELKLLFDAKKNEVEHTLWIRQQDVKWAWQVILNNKPLAKLQEHEGDLNIAHAIPPGQLVDGQNKLEIRPQRARSPDDIRVGQLRLVAAPVAEVLGESQVAFGLRGPARITVTDANGSLVSIGGVKSSDTMAVRPGVIYLSGKNPRFTLPAGRYTIYCGRGFEYSLEEFAVDLKPTPSTDLVRFMREMTPRREVDTGKFAACDTHVHTVTYSRHGDATLTERLITLAAEGIQLPIATDHNLHIDYRKEMERLGIDDFVAVTGNEHTTRTGHFNLWPVDPAVKPPSYIGPEWNKVKEAVQGSGAKVVILNHGEDVHAGFRPFDPKNHNRATGFSWDGREYFFNAMEVVNSAAMLTDGMLLYRDWFGLLNRGMNVVGIGSSDSHDVNRYIVGQGRTYLHCPNGLKVDDAVESLLAGRAKISFGLLVNLGKASLRDGKLAVKLQVQGPSWTEADRVTLFANGHPLGEWPIKLEQKDGRWPVTKFDREVVVDAPPKDAWIIAVARGPGITGPWWPVTRPYQPTSDHYEPYLLGSSMVQKLDRDGDGTFQCAHDYAVDLMRQHGDRKALIQALRAYDRATAAQVAGLIKEDPHFGVLKSAGASEATVQGFTDYAQALRAYRRAGAE